MIMSFPKDRHYYIFPFPISLLFLFLLSSPLATG